jgi:hypothetical protein
MNVYKVYIHTEEDPAVSEVVVAADTKKEAEKKAIQHVKKNNPHKGKKTPEQSKKATTILFSKATGKDGCIVIHRVPLEVFKKVKGLA